MFDDQLTVSSVSSGKRCHNVTMTLASNSYEFFFRQGKCIHYSSCCYEQTHIELLTFVRLRVHMHAGQQPSHP